MKVIQSTQIVNIPEGVEVKLDGRTVKVTGPRGTLERSFSHVAVEITKVGKNKLSVVVWFGARKHLACIRTVCTHIKNMITGVLKGYQYKMRAAYSHFPINVAIVNGKKMIEIRNYLGEKIVRRVSMLEGVTVDVTDQKDEIVLQGACLESVSQSAASIQQITSVKNKDIRKFLDGIYVSERTTVVRD